MFHVTILCKEKLPTRHLERSRKISIIVCLQTIIFLKEIKIYMYLRYIYFCFSKSMRSLHFIRFTHFGRDDV